MGVFMWMRGIPFCTGALALFLGACGDSTVSDVAGGVRVGASGDGRVANGVATNGGALCAPRASCEVDHECLGQASNAGQTTFGLRIMELDLTKPTALDSGILKPIILGSVEPTIPGCDLSGAGTFSWLLQFDTVAGTLKTGGAKPVSHLSKGQTFVDEITPDGHHIQPVTFQVRPDADGHFSVDTGVHMTIPVYLDAEATSVVLLPARAARFVNGTISKSQNCIGSFNAEGLDPQSNCMPDDTHPAFKSGASLVGHILLEDANAVTIEALQWTLCAVLARGDSASTEINAAGIRQCSYDGNHRLQFHGDWCDAADGPADVTCFDSVELGATFAASSITIN